MGEYFISGKPENRVKSWIEMRVKFGSNSIKMIDKSDSHALNRPVPEIAAI